MIKNRIRIEIMLIGRDIRQNFENLTWLFRRIKFKDKTPKKLTSLPLFLSILFIYLGVSQISWQTGDYRGIKNYPFLISNSKWISQKFETLYFQLFDESCQYIEDWDRKQYYQYLKSKKKHFVNIYRNFNRLYWGDKKHEILNLLKIFCTLVEADYQNGDDYNHRNIQQALNYFQSKYFQFLNKQYGDTINPDFVKALNSTFLQIDSKLWWTFFNHKSFNNELRQSVQHLPKAFPNQIKKIDDQIPQKTQGFSRQKFNWNFPKHEDFLLDFFLRNIDEIRVLQDQNNDYLQYWDLFHTSFYEDWDEWPTWKCEQEIENIAYRHERFQAKKYPNVLLTLKQFLAQNLDDNSFRGLKKSKNSDIDEQPKNKLLSIFNIFNKNKNNVILIDEQNFQIFSTLINFLENCEDDGFERNQPLDDIFLFKALQYKKQKIWLKRIYTNAPSFFKKYNDLIFNQKFSKIQYINAGELKIQPNSDSYLFWDFGGSLIEPKVPSQITGFDIKRKLSGYSFADIKTSGVASSASLHREARFASFPSIIDIQWSDGSHGFRLNKIGVLNNNKPIVNTEIPFTTDFRYKNHYFNNIFDQEQFFQLKEKINSSSWSIFFFLSTAYIFITLFQDLYRKHTKEFLESCLDFLKRTGVLDDVQWIKQELGITAANRAYRGLPPGATQGKKIQHIIGLKGKTMIFSIVQMVCFLKSKKMKSSMFEQISTAYINSIFKLFFSDSESPFRTKPKPKGFLLVGPPGTGKTLLVQAIAGETGVPVLTQSGGLLQNPRQRGRGARTVHRLFRRAREIAPCIIFIDEIDGVGRRREDMLPAHYDIIYERFDFVEYFESEDSIIPPHYEKFEIERRPEFYDDTDDYWREPEFTQTIQSPRIPIEVLQDAQTARLVLKEQVNILTQLLIEMDGVNALHNILIIGATNRLEILDPALLRPGRLSTILKFNLPNLQCRIDLFKFYTQSSKIGIHNIYWDYFSKQTHGFSSADIASIVFASELTAIETSSPHTLNTLERGIDLITSFPCDPSIFRAQKRSQFFQKTINTFFSKNLYWVEAKVELGSYFHSSIQSVRHHLKIKRTRDRPFFINCQLNLEIQVVLRNCAYSVGKMLWYYCLPKLNILPSISLWLRPKNYRFLLLEKKVQEFEQFEYNLVPLKDIECRFISFFGGKAGECIFLYLPLNKITPLQKYFPIFVNNKISSSDFGIEDDLVAAQALIKLMIEKWYFYFEIVSLEKYHPILENVNDDEYADLDTELLINHCFAQEISVEMEMRNHISTNEQKHSYPAWWMKRIVTHLNYDYFDYLRWSRIYLSDPVNSPRNIEWVEPDEFYHTVIRVPGYCMSWTEFLENARFAISNLLMLDGFNTAFKTLRQFSEFFDFFSDYFLRSNTVREHDFMLKIDIFFKNY
jgi:DNA polymerase III delta prime subunit